MSREGLDQGILDKVCELPWSYRGDEGRKISYSPSEYVFFMTERFVALQVLRNQHGLLASLRMLKTRFEIMMMGTFVKVAALLADDTPRTVAIRNLNNLHQVDYIISSAVRTRIP